MKVMYGTVMLLSARTLRAPLYVAKHRSFDAPPDGIQLYIHIKKTDEKRMEGKVRESYSFSNSPIVQ
jgi:hypothetical protein